jgi:hypothetical protein
LLIQLTKEIAVTTTNQKVGSSNLSSRATLAWSIPVTWVYTRDMGNFSTEGIWGTLDAISLVIEEPQVVVHEADQPDLLSDFTEADILTGEGRADSRNRCPV